jgi:hypothetical protein
MVLWMPRARRMPPLKRSNDDLDVRDARGVDHHGASCLRSITNHVHRVVCPHIMSTDVDVFCCNLANRVIISVTLVDN